MTHTPIASLLDAAAELEPIEAAGLLGSHSADTIHDVLAGLPTEHLERRILRHASADLYKKLLKQLNEITQQLLAVIFQRFFGNTTR